MPRIPKIVLVGSAVLILWGICRESLRNLLPRLKS